MDPYEATKAVFSRIQSLDPDNASKIMGLLLIQDHGEKEMIRLAFGPENLLHSVVVKARQELGISPNTPSTPSTPSSPSPFLSNTNNPCNNNNTTTTTTSTTTNNNNNNNNPCLSLSRQNSSRFLPNGLKIPTSLSISSLASPCSTSSPSWAASVFSDDLISPTPNAAGVTTSNSSGLNPSTPPFYCSGGGRGDHLMDEIQLQEQLSFLNDNVSSAASRLNGSGDPMLFNAVSNWGGPGLPHKRSSSVNDINLASLLDDPTSGLGWKPCLYYARGFCKNGSSCRFVHGGGGLSESDAAALVGSPSKLEMMDQCHELFRSKSMQHHKLMAAMASVSPSSPTFPYSINKGLSFFAQQQQNDSPRAAAAAAAAALMMGEDLNKFGRSRLDNGRPDSNPASRQIYLTFPADSTFREEDVSNYFSIYGPVQDVRIPYQQKRMFGFVTFVYPETVKIILAKGNPHFVCDARVLVKPYKEKGKVPNKFRKQQQ